VVRVLRSVSGKLFKVNQLFEDISMTDGKGAEGLCPLCGGKGHMVLKATVTNHVDSAYWPLLKDKWYWFCTNSSCDMVYYNNNSGLYFLRNEVRSRVFHKERDPSRPVCYCLGVTESMIRDEIFVKKCCDSLEDIQEYTKAGTGKWCPITNPSGKCCREYLVGLVDSLLKEGVPKEVKGALLDVQRGLGLAMTGMGTSKRARAVLVIEGMYCDGCSEAVRGVLENLGVKVVRVSWKEGVAEIEDFGGVSEEAIRQTIEDIGYKVVRVMTPTSRF